jgi:hypothetical protein
MATIQDEATMHGDGPVKRQRRPKMTAKITMRTRAAAVMPERVISTGSTTALVP